jgi:hypothetical protein
MIAWTNDIIEDIARRRCVLVLGAGVSKNSTNNVGNRPKDWKEFLENTIPLITSKVKTEIKKQISSGDFLTACELIKKDLGVNGFNDLLRNEFITPQFNDAEIHKHIFELDSRIVITPNFDKIYDTYATTATRGSITIKKFYDNDIADCIRRPERLIIKIHGSADAPNNLIFTRKDYSEARIKHRDFYHLIDALSVTNTFIFIGCGTNDPDIRLILEDYSFKYSHNREHYIIMPKKSVHSKVQEIFEDTMSLKSILYDSKNNHEELTKSLEDLVIKVEAKRDELANTKNW